MTTGSPGDLRWSFRDNGQSHLLLNPRRPAAELESFELLQTQLNSYPDHYWLLSSGSSTVAGESAKLIGLSKAAFRASARAVNQHLAAEGRDVWGLVLPDFHVGGLAIYARAEMLGNSVIDLTALTQGASFASVVRDFHGELATNRISLLSLVPTQVFDLVAAGLKAPPYLRAVVVGGAALTDKLYFAARALGWPLLPSFGMTETCSQIATAELSSLAELGSLAELSSLADSKGGGGLSVLRESLIVADSKRPERPSNLGEMKFPRLRVLAHCRVGVAGDDGFSRASSVDARTGDVLDNSPLQRGLLRVESESLLTGYFVRRGSEFIFEDPKQSGVLLTKDRVEIQGPWIKALGRSTDYVKVSGEGVDVQSVRERFFADWSLLDREGATVIDVPDERHGARLWLAAEDTLNISIPELEKQIVEWNRSAFPPERLQGHRVIKRLPRTDLGKIAWAELRQMLS